MKKLAYIDALRGYAILMVIAVHASQYYGDLPYITEKLAEQGARGVQLFFVVSALTLCMSWKSRSDGAAAFYIRRVFRIAPMFWLAIPYFVWERGFGPSIYAPDGIGWRHILMTATFTHGLAPDTITSVVPGSWSVADEMMFYGVFPLLIAALARAPFAVAALVVAIVTYLIGRAQQGIGYYEWTMIADPQWRGAWATFTDLWLVQQLPCFLFGMLLFKWIDAGYPVPWPRAILTATALSMILLAFYPSPPLVGWLGPQIQYGMLFALATAALAHWQPRALVNALVCWIGKVSFSAYLIQFAVIGNVTPRASYAVTYGIVAAITVALSSITYLAIEQPLKRLGHRLAGGRKPRAAMPATAAAPALP